MSGGESGVNFVLSGKWQPDWFTKAAAKLGGPKIQSILPSSFGKSTTWELAKGDVVLPVAEGLLGKLKGGLLGQRQFLGSTQAPRLIKDSSATTFFSRGLDSVAPTNFVPTIGGDP